MVFLSVDWHNTAVGRRDSNITNMALLFLFSEIPVIVLDSFSLLPPFVLFYVARQFYFQFVFMKLLWHSTVVFF